MIDFLIDALPREGVPVLSFKLMYIGGGTLQGQPFNLDPPRSLSWVI